MRTFLCAFFIWVAVVSSGAADFQWSVSRFNDRDYVPLSQVQQFYDFTIRSGNFEEVRLVKPNKVLVAQLGTHHLFLNNLHFHLSLPLVKDSGVAYVSRLDLATVIDPVLRPGNIHGANVSTIILDPGHGGNDQGTWSYYGTEKFYALDLANRLAPLLSAAGFNVVQTRSGDTYIGLADRVQFANRHPDSLFISLHFNSGAATRGIETFALTPVGVPSSDNQPSALDFQPNPGNVHDSENIALATAIHGCIMGGIHLPDRGIRRARFHVLKGIAMPGVLIEGGYLGGQDAWTINHPSYRQALAECIAAGIVRYCAAVPENRMQLRSKNAPSFLANIAETSRPAESLWTTPDLSRSAVYAPQISLQLPSNLPNPPAPSTLISTPPLSAENHVPEP